MKITYNVEHLPERKAGGGKQCEEVNRLGSIQRYRKIKKLQDVVDVYRVEKKIYVVKTPERRKA